LVFITAIAFAVACNVGGHHRIAADLIADGVVTPDWLRVYVAWILPSNIRVAVGRVPDRADDISVLLVASRQPSQLARHHPEVIDNCRAYLSDRTVACDQAFLSSFVATLARSTNIDPADYPAFSKWALGHELGHLMTSSEGSFSRSTGSRSTQRNLEQQRQEYAADCWVVANFLKPDHQQDLLDLQRVALEVVNDRTIQLAGGRGNKLPSGAGVIFDYNRVDPYDFNGGGTHPDILLRAITILHVSALATHEDALIAIIGPLLNKLVPDPLWTNGGSPCVTVH
jgi:hypothetical protein